MSLASIIGDLRARLARLEQQANTGASEQSAPSYQQVNANGVITPTLQPGDLIPSAAFARQDCLACDGASYPTASFPALFAAIGYTYGGAGASFNVPDMRQRMVLGQAPAGTGSGNGETGGQVDHAHSFLFAGLSIPGLAVPNHLHTLDAGNGFAWISASSSGSSLYIDAVQVMPGGGSTVPEPAPSSQQSIITGLAIARTAYSGTIIPGPPPPAYVSMLGGQTDSSGATTTGGGTTGGGGGTTNTNNPPYIVIRWFIHV